MRRVLPSFCFAAFLLVLLSSTSGLGFASDTPSAVFAAPVNRVIGNVDESVRVPLRGQVHPQVRTGLDQGAVSDSLPMQHIIMLLRRSPEQELALQTRIDQMHNQRSELFHSWLNAKEVGNSYGVSDADISAVTNWLQGHGFGIDSVPAGKTMIVFTGTAGQVREAFHTEIHHLIVNGKIHIANVSEPEIPLALAPVVAGFRSLDDFFPKPTVKLAGVAKRNPQTGKLEIKPLAQSAASSTAAPTWPNAFPNATYANGAQLVGPEDFYTIYNESPLLTGNACNGAPCDGTGQTVAVIEETDVCNGQSGTLPNNCNGADDLAAFRSQFGLPNTPVNYMFGIPDYCSDPGVQGSSGTGEEVEADLDLQWTRAVAPGATIDFIACASTNASAGIDLAATYAVNNLAGSVSSFSVSYGACEAAMGSFNTFYNLLWQQAAAQGQTVEVSAGDSGDDTCDRGSGLSGGVWVGSVSGWNVNGLASTPFNVAAGGTDFSDNFTIGNAPFLGLSDPALGANPYWNGNDTAPYGSALRYVPEMTWNETCGSKLIANLADFYFHAQAGTTVTPELVCNHLGGDFVGGSGGGGVSSLHSLPTWQSVYGVGLTGNYTSRTKRNLPDVSLFAASGLWNHALLFCESDISDGVGGDFACNYSGQFIAAGGTSFVAPQINGLMALINQRWSSANPAQATRQGQANYTFYALANHEYGTVSGRNSSTTAPSTLTCESNYISINHYSTIFPSCVFYNLNRTPAITTSTCGGGGTQACVTDGNVMPCPTGSVDCFTLDKVNDPVGLLSMSTTSFQPAWPQSAGFSDAVGLGSFNITNLVNNWTSSKWVKPFISKTTVLASPTPITVDQTTTLTATVTATGRGSLAPPLGTVNFRSGTSCTLGTFLGTAALEPANNCTTSCNSVATLDGTTGLQLGGAGAKSFIACFSGDGANDAPSFGTATATVTKGNTTTALAGSANPTVFGQPVSFTATVSPATATGTVTFRDGATTLGTAALSSGTAIFTTTKLIVGSNHMISASYGGSVNYNTSSASLSGNPQVVNKADSSLQVVASPNPSVLNQSVKFTATVTPVAPATGTPTGTVTFLDGGTAIGTGTLSAGVASLITAKLTLGSHDISVTYAGSTSFNGSGGSLSGGQTVNPGNVIVKVTSSLNPSGLGKPVKFTASVAAVAPTTGTPTGSITFFDGDTQIGSPVALITGVGSITTAALTAGGHAIKAVYSGDSRFNTGNGTLTETVSKGSSKIVLVSSLNPSLSGQSVTFTATVSAVAPATGTPTGTVTFLDGTTTIGAGDLSGGVAAVTTSALTVGSHTISARYGGDTSFNISSASMTGNPQVVK